MAVNDIGPRIGIEGEAEFRKSIAAINAEMKALGAEMKAVTAEFAANASGEDALAAKNEVLGRSAQAAQSKLALLDGQLDRQKQKLVSLGAELDKAAAEFGANSKEAARAQNAYNQQYRTVAQMEGQYQSARAELASFQNAMDGVGEATQEATQQLSAQDVLAGVGAWTAIEGTFHSIAAAIGDCVQTGMEFDAAVADIAATMGTTVEDLDSLRGFALEMGATTSFTATEAAQALNYMALAGYDAQTAMETLPTVLDLAAAGGVELARASDMVTDAQSALGLSLEETSRLVDEMAQTSTKTNTSVEQLGEAMLEVGGTAKFLSGGTAEISQVLGLLADNSIKGAEGGTKLRNIILSLSSPTEKAAKRLDDLGVAVFDAEGNMRSFSDIFPEMQRALSDLTSQQQIEALGEIFNSRDIAAAQALLGTTVERWDELALAIDGAQGAAARMAETRLDNLAGDLTLMESAADSVKIAISDSLTPAFRDLVQAGTGVLTVVGDFISDVPMAGQVLAGLTAGLGVLTVGMGAAAISATQLGAAFSAAWATVAASPLAPIALAVGAGVTAFTALSAAMSEADQTVQNLTESIEESNAAMVEQVSQASASADDTLAMVQAIEDLAATENKTAAEKETLISLVDQLNEKVPELNLEYDSLNDTLSLTADQIREIAIAEAQREAMKAVSDRLSEAYVQQYTIAKELEEAQRELEEAERAYAEASSEAQSASVGAAGSTEDLRIAVEQAQEKVAGLTELQAQNDKTVSELQGAYDSASEKIRENAEAMDEAAEASDGTSEEWSELIASAQALEDATLYATGATDALTEALKEQQKNGTLSVATTQELIDAGYGAALALDEETGAVTVDQEAYLALTKTKIQEKISDLEVQKQRLNSVQTLLKEKAAASEAAGGFWELAKAKLAEMGAEDPGGIDAQIASLRRAMDALGSYTVSVESSARRSSAASKRVKTQAEEDLATYKSLKAELDHEKAMDLVDEAGYYRRLGELRDQYLADEANVDEYRKVTEAIYKADQEVLEQDRKALEQRQGLWQTAGDNILKLEEEFQQKLSSRAQEIINSYKLFEEVPEKQEISGQKLMENLEGQIESIQSFYDNINALSERGVSAELVDEIRGMGVSASDELEGLLTLSDEKLTEYSELFGKKQELANKIAMEELSGLRDQTNDAILDQLSDVAELYDTNAPALGLAFANSLADGMFEGLPAVESMAQTVASAAMSAFERTYDRDVEAMMTASKPRVTSGDIGELLAGAVNGINTGSAGASYPIVDVTLQLDQQTLARAQVDPMRQAFKERPETLDDR